MTLCVCVCVYVCVYTTGHHWDSPKCPDYRGVWYTKIIDRTLESVLIKEVSVLNREVPLYIHM